MARATSTAITKSGIPQNEAINRLALQIVNDSVTPVRQNHRDCLHLAHEVYQIGLGKRTDIRARIIIARLAMLGLKPKDIIALADRKEERVLQMIGIVASHATSVVINNLFAGDQQADENDELAVIRALLEFKRDKDVQDGEIVEDEAGGADATT